VTPWIICSEVLLRTTPERVWHELTDFTALPDWNPFLRKASGRLAEGERLRIRLTLDHGLPLPLQPKLTVVRPHQELRWLATVVRPGIFDVDRGFQILPHAGGLVRFVMSERCTGALAPLLRATNLEAQIYRGYDAMNTALRERVES
jgi:hypothetical protein